jgi:hypothetical protein
MVRRLIVLILALVLVGPQIRITPANAGPAADQVALLEQRVSSAEADILVLKVKIAGLEALASAAPSPSSTGTPVPTATAGPTPTATVTPTPTPTATPGPSNPLPTPVACGTTLQALVDAAASGSTVDLGTCVYTAGATIGKPLTLVRGTIRQAGTGLRITANDVTIDGTSFDGGNRTVQISGDRAKILGSSFARMTETSIDFLPGADAAVLDGVTITQTILTVHGYSPISANDGSAGVGTFKGLTIRNSTIDQGPSGVAWFGVEVWGVSGLLIESNIFKGAGFHISIPRSDGAIVRGNTFELGLGAKGIELADIDNVQFTGNTGFAAVPADMTKKWVALVQMHPGNGTVNNTTITGNRQSPASSSPASRPSATTASSTCRG